MPAGDDSNNRLTAMSIADIRAYVTSEMSRLKDDVSELYDKLNALKDASAADRLQVITQLNHEVQNFNNRLNDFSIVIQKVVGDSEHTETSFAQELKTILLEVDNRLLRCKDIHGTDNSTDITSLEIRMDSVEKSLGDLKRMVTSLDRSEKQTKSKVQNLGWKVGLLIAGLVWLATTFGPDIIKSGVSSLTTQNAQPATQPVAAPSGNLGQPPPVQGTPVDRNRTDNANTGK